MAKLILLPLCLCIYQGLQAQDYRSTDIADISIPQKLEFRKADFGWVDRSNYFAKKSYEEDDSVKSVVYLGPPRKDSIDLNLPPLQPMRKSFRPPMRRLPPLRIQD
jgi:hypothetical protein